MGKAAIRTVGWVPWGRGRASPGAGVRMEAGVPRAESVVGEVVMEEAGARDEVCSMLSP